MHVVTVMLQLLVTYLTLPLEHVVTVVLQLHSLHVSIDYRHCISYSTYNFIGNWMIIIIMIIMLRKVKLSVLNNCPDVQYNVLTKV